MVADGDLVARARSGAAERARQAEPVDLGRERLRALRALDVVTRDRLLDLAARDPEDAVVAQQPPGARSGVRPVDEEVGELGLADRIGRGRLDRRDRREQRAAQRGDALAGRARDAEDARLAVVVAQHLPVGLSLTSPDRLA